MIDKTISIFEIEIAGRKIANRIRILLAVALLAVVIATSSNNPIILTILFLSGIAIFFTLSIINIVTTSTGKDTLLLKYLTVFVEASLPSILKIGFIFSDMAYQVINESTLYSIYWIVILLTILHNNRRLTFFAGIVIVVEYIFLLAMCLIYWEVPYLTGIEKLGYIALDSEIIKVVLLISFTAFCIVILKNMNFFVLKAIDNGEIAKNRTSYLEGIISKANQTSHEMVGIGNIQSDIVTQFSDMSRDQASTSKQLSDNYRKLTSSLDSINLSMKEQTEKVETTMTMVDILMKTQAEVRATSDEVQKNISDIVNITDDADDNLSQMMEKMELIGKGGESISNFIALINDITDKINLLSLNAAIEAARAGDHGKGFAVVADEIGKLASATSDNSLEISTQIKEIIADINDGMGIAEFTRQSTSTIFKTINGIKDKITEVKDTMTEQGEAIEKVAEQVRMIESTAKIIELATSEQQSAMQENSKVVIHLTDIASEIASYNEKLLTQTELIDTKAKEIEYVIKSTESEE